METHDIFIGILVLGLIITSGLAVYTVKAPTIIQQSTNTQAQQDTISLSANSKLTVAPDQAELYFRIQTEGKTAIDAQEGNKRASNTVLGALKAKGVKEKDIETTQYYISKKQKYDPKTGESTTTGYELIHVLKVTITDLENVGSLVDTGVSAGSNGVNNILFTLTDNKEKEVRDQALAAAGKLGKEKAQTLASSMDVSLGRLVSISETSFNYTPYSYESRNFAALSLAEKAEPTQIQPQSLDITAMISVVYEIKP